MFAQSALLRKVCLTILLCLAMLPAMPAAGAERPKVGLALSGGSALGLAHVGIIRYFEEHHIPIDRIGGTSMGGLVAGLYAAGMDSRALTSVAEHADWGALLDPGAPFSDQPVVDKQNWNRTSGDIALRFRPGFSLPAGLNPGAALSLLLSNTTKAYASVTDFDQLPTPFRCVATDLISGEPIVLSRGSLPVAMRATMSLPGIFTPVKLGQMVLVDGGVLENIPVDPVRAMGSQIVIAVELLTPKPRPEQFKSLTEVLRQTASIAVAQNERRSLAKADLVISVDTTKFSGTDFKHWRELMDAGYRAAQQHAPELSRFQLSDEEWEAYLAERRSRMRPVGDNGRVLAVTSPDASFQKNAQAEMHRKLGDVPVSEQKLNKVLTGMVAATAVPGAAYQWEQNGTSEGFKVEFAERPNDQVLVHVSPMYAYSPGEPTRFNLRLTTITVLQSAYKARFLTTSDMGYDPGFQGEAYKPFGGSPYFITSQVFLRRTHINNYSGPTRQSEFRDRVGGAVYTGIGTWRFAQLRLGGQAGYDSFSNSTALDGVASHSGGYTSPELRWTVNTQDSGGLPTHGIRAEGAAGYMFRSNSNYPFLHHDFSGFRPVGGGLTLFATNHAATSFGRKLGFFDRPPSGAQWNMAAYRYQEFHANSFVNGGLGAIYRGIAIPHFALRPGIAAWYEAGRFDLGSQGWQTHQSTSVGIVFPTRLGASGLTVSFDEQGKARFRVMVGNF